MSDSPPPRIVGPAGVGPVDVLWQKKAEELEFKALDNVRSAGEKWGVTLGALLGLTGTVLVVKGPESVTDLTSGGKLAVGLTLALAFLAAIAATVLAALAAQGTPRRLNWPSGPRLREWEHGAALKAKNRLFWSRACTLVAVLAIAVAVAFAWFGPEAEASGSTVLLAPEQGAPLCGKLVNGSAGVELKVGDKTTPAPPGPYTSVVAVDSCPSQNPASGQSE